jgi:hypothetical protein
MEDLFEEDLSSAREVLRTVEGPVLVVPPQAPQGD